MSHISPKSVYFSIFGALMALTALTVYVAFQHLGWLNFPVAISIALIKASLVVLFFMHVKYSSKLTKLLVGSTFFFLASLFGLTMTDYLSRGWVTSPRGTTTAGMLPKLAAAELPGVLPTLRDWADHTTTAFPEVRLKKFLEMRGADGGPWNRLCALPAFWVGLLYDQTALDAAWDLVKDFTREERHALRDGVPKHALKLPFRRGTLHDIAAEALKISAHGLARRARNNRHGADESMFLDILAQIVDANQTPAERKLELYHGAWNGDIDRVFREFAY
jgi:caa(3)-type oxidase subunit IV